MMAKQYLTVNKGDSTSISGKGHIIKTYSFNTDEDDPTSVVRTESVSNRDKLLSINSPSTDNADIEDNSLERSTKLKKRKSRRLNDAENNTTIKEPPIKRHLWHQNIHWTRTLMYVGILIFLYFTWTKRDIWIPRILTTSNRIRSQIIIKNEEETTELKDLSSNSPLTIPIISSKSSLLDSSNQYDIMKNVKNKSEEINLANNEDLISSSTKSSSPNKLNLRVRRNKMSFSREQQNKNRRRSQDSTVDDNNLDDDIDEEKNVPIKSNTSHLSLSNRSTKKNHRYRSVTQHKSLKTYIPLNTNIRLSTYDNIIDQLRKNLKSQYQDRNFLSTISKITGLNKRELYRFIHKKEYKLLTPRRFILLLDAFNLMLIVVPK